MCQRDQNSEIEPDEVGLSEILHQLDADDLRGADGDVRVAGEIAVDLNGEAEGRHDERSGRGTRVGSA